MARITPDLKRYKIIILLESLELGGAERQAVILANVLKINHGAKIEIWGLSQQSSNNRLIPFCEELGVVWHIIEIEMPTNWIEWIDWLPQFKEILTDAKPDILLSYYSTNITAGILWRQVGAKTCIWGQRDEGRYRPPYFIEALATANTPWFISNSKDGIEFLQSTLKIDSSRLTQIRNGTLLPKSSGNEINWRVRLGIDKSQLLVTMVANLHKFKDHFTLINAWSLVVHSSNNIERQPVLALAGSLYDTAEELKALTSTLNLSDNILFLGHVADVHGLLSESDIYVHSSLFEGIPNGILEAMAMGLPVVATDIEGIREALGSSAAEWLASPKDAKEFSKRISRLSADADLRRETGAFNRKRIESEFGVDRLGVDTLNVIIQATKNSRPWSLLGWFIVIPNALNLLLLMWKLTTLYCSQFNELLRTVISKTPLIWRILK